MTVVIYCQHQSTPINREDLYKDNFKKYPFLDEDDPRLKMTESEILGNDIDLDTNCILDMDEKADFRESLLQQWKAFSLYTDRRLSQY